MLVFIPKAKKYSDSVSVFLHNDTGGDLFLKLAAYYVNLNNIKQEYYGGDKMLKVNSQHDFGWHEFSKYEKMTHYAPEGILKLIFEITILEVSDESAEFVDDRSNKNSLVLSQDYHRDQHFQDLDQLFSSKMFADFTIRCGDKTFKCHKNILASRSPVFKAMFESKMKENESGSVEIQNISPEVLENMLQYIYTCNVSSIDKMPKELFIAADQYQVEKLKEHCEEKLISVIDVENCMDLLVLGESHQVMKLKAKALKFVSKNIGNFDSNEWKETLIAYPSLLVEVMEMMMPKRKSCDDNSEGIKRARAK